MELKLIMQLKNTLTELNNLLFPAHCLVCGRTLKNNYICSYCIPEQPSNQHRCHQCFTPLTEEYSLCLKCESSPVLFQQIRYLWNYQGAPGHLIRTMKYRPSQKLCYLAGDYLAAALPYMFNQQDWDLLIPVPSSYYSLAYRGFNQCTILAKRLKKTYPGLAPIKPEALKVNKHEIQQASLPPEKRWRNIKNSFTSSKKLVQGKKILLIDDVATTGATVIQAARTLYQGGATSLDLMTLARSAPWNTYFYALSKKA